MSNESRAIRFAIAAAITLAAAVQVPQAAAAAKSPAAATPTAPASDEDKTFYALGVLMSRNLAAFDLSSAEVKLVEQGLTDGINHRPALDAEGYNTQLQTLQRTRLGVIDERQKAAGEAFLNKAAAEHGAQKTSTGMVFIPVLEGSGASPEHSDRVSVLYEGKLTDGTVFDSTAKHGGQPVALSLGGVIPCWTEALQLMKVGGKSRVVCPSSLAYGDRGAMPTILPGSTLEFSIQLVEILPKTAAPAAGAPKPAAPDAAGGSSGAK
jgi:FKBP-type peptidyl-prolyl cis-trans isomerase FkpA